MSDLLSDLQADLAAAPAPAPEVPVQRRAALPTAPLQRRTTPAFEVRVTPLRWSLPALGFDGGPCLRVGPVQVGLVRR